MIWLELFIIYPTTRFIMLTTTSKYNTTIATELATSTDLVPDVIAYLKNLDKIFESGKSAYLESNKKSGKGSLSPQNIASVRLLERMTTMGELTDNILVYAVALIEKCRSHRNFQMFGSANKLFAAVMFIAQKVVQDGEFWFLPEFEIISEVSQN